MHLVRVDIPGLCSDALLQSIYAEVLRLRSGTVIFRVPTEPQFRINGWHMRQDEPIIVSTYDAARDRTVWNTGPGNLHPLDEFWAERFIVYAGDPSSGPIKTQTDKACVPNAATTPAVADLSNHNNQPKFSLEGTAGAWIPYGGGSRMCPGRHFAKEEVIVTSAMLLGAFEIELLGRNTAGQAIEPDMAYFMFGTMHPKGQIAGRMRRRT